MPVVSGSEPPLQENPDSGSSSFPSQSSLSCRSEIQGEIQMRLCGKELLFMWFWTPMKKKEKKWTFNLNLMWVNNFTTANLIKSTSSRRQQTTAELEYLQKTQGHSCDEWTGMSKFLGCSSRQLVCSHVKAGRGTKAEWLLWGFPFYMHSYAPSDWHTFNRQGRTSQDHLLSRCKILWYFCLIKQET